MLIDRARPERLRDVVARLVDEHPETDVLLSAPELSSAPHGSTVLLRLRPEDAPWLNLGRPVVSERALRLVLWSEEATTIGLMQGAIDFYDWITARIECPTGPPAFAVNELRRAALARSPAVVWRGGDLDAVFKEAVPGRELSRVSAALPYPEIVAAMTPKGRTWIAVTDIDGRFRWRRVQWATAEARRWARTILVEPTGLKGSDTGMLPAAGADPMGLDEAAARLAEAGLSKPARLAALLDLSPAAIGRALAWAKRGGTAAMIEERVRAEPDLERALPPAEGEGGSHRGAAGAVWPRRLPDLPARARMALDAGDPVVSGHWASEWLARVEAAEDGGESADLATALHALGLAKERLGDLAEARRLLERAVWVEERLSGAEQRLDVAASLHELATVHRKQGDLARAHALLQRTLDIWTRVLGTEEDLRVAASMHELAMVRHAQGDATAARELIERALRIEVGVLGTDEHADVAASLHGLAVVLHDQHNLAAARETLQRALRIWSKVLGTEEHPSVAAGIHELARVREAQGDLTTARELYERALRIWEKTLGTEQHPSVAAVLDDLAHLDEAQGDLSLARRRYERALAIERRVYGDHDHYSTAVTEANLGRLLAQMGEVEQALELVRHAHQVLVEKVGPNHLSTRTAARHLDQLARATGPFTG